MYNCHVLNSARRQYSWFGKMYQIDHCNTRRSNPGMLEHATQSEFRPQLHERVREVRVDTLDIADQ